MGSVATLIFGAALVVAATAVGGVHTPVAATVCALAALACALQWLQLRGREQVAVYVSVPVIGLLLLFGFSVLQIIALPEVVQTVLSPEGHRVTSDGLVAAGFAPETGWRPLSLDPAATSDRALRFGALALMGLFAANLRSRQAWITVGRAILITAFLVLLVGGGLYLTKMREFGPLYTSAVGFRAPSTFVNLNHGASFFGLAALVGVSLGLGADRRRLVEGAGFWAAALVFAVIAGLHDSDGVVLAFGASLGVGAVVLWNRAGRPTQLGRETKIAAVALVLLAAALSWWLDLHVIAHGFFERLLFEGGHGNRLELLRAGAAMVAEYWPAGAGAGAVETVIPGYMNWSSTTTGATIPVLENDTLELLFGFGIFIGGIAVAAAASVVFFAWRHAFDTERTMRYALVLPSAFYLFAIAQLHFPLFALGLGVPAVVWIESLMARRGRDGRDPSVFDTGHVLLPTRWAAVLLTVIVVAAFGAGVAHYTVFSWAFPETLDAEQARRAIELRPSDHRIYVRLATQAAQKQRPDDAVRLAEFARSRNALPRVRLFLARARAGAGDEAGARAHYDALIDADKADALLIRAALADFEDAATRVALFADAPELWGQVAQTIVRVQGGPAAADFALALVEAHPEDAGAYAVATETYLRMKRPYLAQLWAELLVQRDITAGNDIHGTVLLARAMVAAGDEEEAARLLDAAIEGDSAPSPAELHRLALSLRPDVTLATPQQTESIRRHHEFLCPSPVPPNHLRLCWETEAWLAETSGDLSRAEVLLKRIRNKFDEPFPLIHLWMRHEMCHEISRLSSRTRPDSPNAARIEEMVSRCLNASK